MDLDSRTGLMDSNQSMDFFRARRQQVVVSQIFGKSAVTMARLSCEHKRHGVIDPPVHEDAFFLAFNLRNYSGDLWVDGRKTSSTLSRAGNFTLYDYRRTWLADMQSSFDGLGFHIPRSALQAYEEDLGGQHVETLVAEPGVDIEDDVVRQLVGACIPVLDNPQTVSRLFQDQITAVLTFHVCSKYGTAKLRKRPQGALAPWQEKLATQMLLADLTADPSLSAIAAACELSQGYFTRAFKASTGYPPYKWVMLKRIEKAKDLLRMTDLKIAEVALLCGFCDQAHLTRVFSANMGVTPFAYRRASR